MKNSFVTNVPRPISRLWFARTVIRISTLANTARKQSCKSGFRYSFCLCLVGAGMILIGSCELMAQRSSPSSDKTTLPTQEGRARGGIFTLYGWDPVARTLCFSDGRPGMMILKNRIENRCSDLSFTTAGGGSLVTAIEADRVGAIIDLGTADELRQRYGYDDAEGGGEGFASLRMVGQKIMILKEDNPTEELQPLKEGPSLFSDVGPSANAPIKFGHIYLVRLAGRKDSSFQLIVKLIVIGYIPNESVTVRWEAM